MPEDELSPDGTLAFAKALLEYFRSCAKELGGSRNLDLFARSFLVLTVVFIGENEGHPFTVPDVANYTGMSRSTVQREVLRLVDRGLVRFRREGRRKVIVKSLDNSARTYRGYLKATRDFLNAVSDLR